MIIQDGVAERRNLVVMSLAIMVYYFGGGEILENQARLLLVSVKFHNPTVLFTFVWILFIYFIFRYRVTSKSFDQESIRFKMHGEFRDFLIKEKYYSYLLEELEKSSVEGSITGLEFNRWAILYNQNSIVLEGRTKNGANRHMDVKGFSKRWITFKTMFRGYFKLPNVNAYYTPYLMAWVALITLGYSTYLKICTEILKKSC